MANRYKNFEVLMQEDLGINHMPGTLGRHHYLIVSKSDAGIVVRGVSSFGEKSKPLTVRPGGGLGYDLGRIWVIPPRVEMTPLQKLRSDFRIAKNNLHVISEDKFSKIEIEEMISSIDPDSPHANHGRFWGDGEMIVHETKNVIITERLRFKGGVDQRRFLWRVFLAKENLEHALNEARSALLQRYGEHYQYKHLKELENV